MFRTWIFAAIAVVILAGSAFAQEFGPLQGRVFGSGSKSVIVFLHGDISRGGPANYHYNIAQTMASQNKSATVIALLRPGYDDGHGRKSPGTNHKRRDQYTSKNNKLVAQTLASIRKSLPGRKMIVVGHSGGAAQLGSVIGQNRGLVDTAILLSCPCHLKNWFDSHADWNPKWKRSQSPHKYVGKLDGRTKIYAVTGAQDDNTRPALALEYAAAAKARGVPAKAVIVKGGDHSGNNALRSALYKIVKSEAR